MKTIKLFRGFVLNVKVKTPIVSNDMSTFVDFKTRPVHRMLLYVPLLPHCVNTESLVNKREAYCLVFMRVFGLHFCCSFLLKNLYCYKLYKGGYNFIEKSHIATLSDAVCNLK